MDILLLIIGILSGGVIGWFIAKNKFQSQNTIPTEKFIEINSQLAAKEKELQYLQEKLDNQKNDIENLNGKFKSEFENLANKILDDKSQKFTKQNSENIGLILNPLKERIKDFEEKIDASYKVESTERITLKTEIKNLIELNNKISQEANNLATALKGDNKTQGNWGELILEKILERSGLTKGIEYETQYSTTNIDGQRIQPDVIINLPDNKKIIVDSKVSLVAYDAYVNSIDETDRERLKKEHINSVRSHIKLLSEKKYQTATEIISPDFVMLFTPIESSFSIAIQADTELFNFAWDKKIVIVTPSTLLATLKTVASIWKQEKQTRNALEIAEEGGKLYDKFVLFVEDLISIGKKMDESKTSYNEAMKKLHEGSGNLVKRAEKMKALGAKTNKTLPSSLVERSNEGDKAIS